MDDERNAQDRIAGDLLNMGLRPGGVALAHSSLSSLGRVPGSAETVIRGLLQALGPQGTLLMPALSYEHANAAHPRFDVLGTPSNVGIIPETFRARPGTLRSVCPTHSVCGTGPLAAEMLSEHHLDDTPCGPHSPFRKLPEHDGQIVFLGCGLRPNTSMHSVEEVVVPPYLFGRMITYEVVWPDAMHRAQDCRSHDFAGWAQRYDRIDRLLPAGALHSGMVMAAQVFIVETRPMWEVALAAYRSDPLYFVEPRGA
ncbi:MAG: AAC(3) family N-acetyltransferase [Chloroflexi bacterium]|nr:AAC(3) family N-acetyltransferase [Chloroflexota bacterium]MCL5275567.1 AAC(3) family N-acetyltransferase [Chloroflexota bacterium]